MIGIVKRLGPFAHNLAAYAASEVAAKLSRLLVVVAVARTMDAASIGIAAAALAASDILASLTENGAVQRIIAAPADQLEATCATAHRLFWAWCAGLFVIQIAVGAVLYQLNGDVRLFWLIAILAGEILCMPGGIVQVGLAMREGKLKQTAAIAASQVVGANLMSALFAVLTPGPIALVLPRLLSGPIWLVAVRHLRPWQRDETAGYTPAAPFLRYGASVLGVELVKALRLQADKLLIGALMGVNALGLYFMAFNAGLGLATSFSTAFATVLFPHLCVAQDRRSALRQAMLMALGIIAPVVVLQSLLAPYYVPILFGAHWANLGGIVSTLCLAAIPAVIWSAAAQSLRAEGQAHIEFAATLGITCALLANTVLTARYGLPTLAAGYLVTATLTQIGASWPALRRAFGPKLAQV